MLLSPALILILRENNGERFIEVSTYQFSMQEKDASLFLQGGRGNRKGEEIGVRREEAQLDYLFTILWDLSGL